MERKQRGVQTAYRIGNRATIPVINAKCPPIILIRNTFIIATAEIAKLPRGTVFIFHSFFPAALVLEGTILSAFFFGVNAAAEFLCNKR